MPFLWIWFFPYLLIIMLRLIASANRSSVSVRKDKERGNLSWFLFRFGVNMPSYSSYTRAGVRYLADARRSERYAEYIKYNKPGYNVFRIPVSLIDKMIRDERKLES